MSENRADVLVIGGGIAGMTAAIEAAEAGCGAVIVEKSATLGGRVAQMHQYFPKLCPPACGLEINYRRLRANARVEVLTLATVENVTGSPGAYDVTVRIAPRYVTADCTACGECAKACPAERADEHNCGLSKTKAIYLPHGSAYPQRFVVDAAACQKGCDACVQACKYSAIDLKQQAWKRTYRVSSIVAATGWAPYDAAKLDNLGGGKIQNVVTNVILERLAAADGPTGGKILRPSDGKAPRSIAFVQCAGSRDENHLPYCSGVCCTAALKQATYVRALYPDAQIKMFYIDVRTVGRLEEFFTKAAAETGIELVKGKVAKIEEVPGTADVKLSAEDVMAGTKSTYQVEMAVLATGLVPQTAGLPAGFATDEFGFLTNGKSSLCAAGSVRRPVDVSAAVKDGTRAALKALQSAAHAAEGSAQHA